MSPRPQQSSPPKEPDRRSPPWFLVETLSPDRAALVSLGRRARDLSSLSRAVKALVGGRFSAHIVTEMSRSIDRVRSSARPFDTTFPTGARRTRVLVDPVVGPRGRVHGVHVWIGDADSDTPDPVPQTALAFEFEARRRSFVVDANALARLAGRELLGGRASFTSPEVFRYVDVDDAMGAIGALLSPSPDAGFTWSGLASAPEFSQGSRLHIVFTAPGDGASWRGLVHAVESDFTSPARLESAAFAAFGEVAPQTALVLMDITHNRLIRWLTDSVPSIQWKGIVDDRDTPHPDDVERIITAASGMFAGTDTKAEVDGIRLRRIGGGWTVVNARGALLPREEGGPGLMLVQMVVVGTSDDVDPVPHDDPGRSIFRP